MNKSSSTTVSTLTVSLVDWSVVSLRNGLLTLLGTHVGTTSTACMSACVRLLAPSLQMRRVQHWDLRLREFAKFFKKAHKHAVVIRINGIISVI